MWRALARKQFLGYIVAVVVVAATTAILKIFSSHVNPTTVALTLLLIVLLVAMAWGPKPAVVASLLGAASFNFFFLPPVGTFSISEPENWIALGAFLVTAITVGQLSARARRQTDEATSAREEIERLYHELQDTFERSSQAKALKQSEQLKTALLDAVTHDLRTPLTSIKASVTTLLDEQRSMKKLGEASLLGDEGRQEMLEVIDEEADRLDQFIAGLMEMARIEAGELQLRKHWSSVDEIMMAAMKRAEPRTRGRKIELWLDQELPSLNVDERALVEVVYILVDNAAKYAPPGSVIRVAAKMGSSDAVRIIVEDEGPGIEPALRERVFNKFYRAGIEGDQGIPSGTGMGLAIAYGIVHAHGGRIWIEEAQGGGARFNVELVTNGDVKDG